MERAKWGRRNDRALKRGNFEIQKENPVNDTQLMRMTATVTNRNSHHQIMDMWHLGDNQAVRMSLHLSSKWKRQKLCGST